MSIAASAAAKALNHLLEQEPWARARLSPFVGDVVELRFAPLPPLRIAVVDGGRVLHAESASEATLVIAGGPGLLAALSKGEEHLMRAVQISGNDRLAAEVLFLLRNLRWDVEEDLSHAVGDILAHRMVRGAREFAAWHAEAAQRLAENLVEYAVEERGIVVARAEFDLFAREVARLRDDLARLEQRVARLKRPAGADGP